MESKEQLISNVKEWVKIDTEILKLKAEIKERAKYYGYLDEDEGNIFIEFSESIFSKIKILIGLC